MQTFSLEWQVARPITNISPFLSAFFFLSKVDSRLFTLRRRNEKKKLAMIHADLAREGLNGKKEMADSVNEKLWTRLVQR